MASTTQKSFILYKSLIMETVKNETHITAHVARASDKNASELAFHEEAGDEEYHSRKLERSLYASIDKAKAAIIGYLNTESGAGNNISTTWTKDSAGNDDKLTVTLSLSSRFNPSYLAPLADLISKYIEDNMLHEWWTPINQNFAKMYSEKAAVALSDVLRCFIKNAPNKSTKTYSDIWTDTATSNLSL